MAARLIATEGSRAPSFSVSRKSWTVHPSHGLGEIDVPRLGTKGREQGQRPRMRNQSESALA